MIVQHQIDKDWYREHFTREQILNFLVDRDTQLIALRQRVEALEQIEQFIGLKFDEPTQTYVSGVLPYLSAGTTKVEACIAAVDAVRMAASVLEEKLAAVTKEREELAKELSFDDIPWTEAFRVKRDKGKGLLSKQDIGILVRIARNRHRKSVKLYRMYTEAMDCMTGMGVEAVKASREIFEQKAQLQAVEAITRQFAEHIARNISECWAGPNPDGTEQAAVEWLRQAKAALQGKGEGHE